MFIGHNPNPNESWHVCEVLRGQIAWNTLFLQWLIIMNYGSLFLDTPANGVSFVHLGMPNMPMVSLLDKPWAGLEDIALLGRVMRIRSRRKIVNMKQQGLEFHPVCTRLSCGLDIEWSRCSRLPVHEFSRTILVGSLELTQDWASIGWMDNQIL